MSVILEQLKEDILNEAKQIQETINRLISISSQINTVSNDYTLEPAAGTFLMNFYNGVENILKRITKVYYQKSILKNDNWHKELLDLSFNPPADKIPIFTLQVVEKLYQYKNFRHRFISGYGFQLKMEKMLDLINDAEPLWRQISNELDEFLKKVL